MQNDAGTRAENWHKFDTADTAFVPSENEKPGAMAGTIGATFFEVAYRCEEYRARSRAADVLCQSIADCHPDDAVVILSAALRDLSMGAPLPMFLSAMDDARWWASFAAPYELKAYALACFEAMRPGVRSAFLRHVQRTEKA